MLEGLRRVGKGKGKLMLCCHSDDVISSVWCTRLCTILTYLGRTDCTGLPPAAPTIAMSAVLTTEMKSLNDVVGSRTSLCSLHCVQGNRYLAEHQMAKLTPSCSEMLWGWGISMDQLCSKTKLTAKTVCLLLELHAAIDCICCWHCLQKLCW